MPDWVKDEDKWNDAKKAFKKSYDKEPKTDKDWAIVTDIYKKMGGEIESVEKMLEQLENNKEDVKMESYKEKLDKLHESVMKEAEDSMFKNIKSKFALKILSIFHNKRVSAKQAIFWTNLAMESNAIDRKSATYTMEILNKPNVVEDWDKLDLYL